MDMKINSALIKSERESRAWSQEHLARVSGLGLRTVQRIEATGSASYESVTALASVLELHVSELRIENARIGNRSELAPVARKWHILRPLSALTASLVAAVGLFLVQSVAADDVMLDVSLRVNDLPSSESRLLATNGEEVEIRIDDVVRLVITPTIRTDGGVLLTTKVYEANGNEYVLIAEPILATESRREAEIQISREHGNEFRFVITPSIQ